MYFKQITHSDRSPATDQSVTMDVFLYEVSQGALA